MPEIHGPFNRDKILKLTSRTLFAPVTNALFASLQGLLVGPFTLSTTPLPLRLQARSSPGATMMQSLWLPSAARQRPFRCGCVSLVATLRSPLHFPRLPTADRSPMSFFRLWGQPARFRLAFQQFPRAGELRRQFRCLGQSRQLLADEHFVAQSFHPKCLSRRAEPSERP
jgi:hypothetical protein